MGIEFNQNVNPSAVTFNGSAVSAVRFNGIHVWPDGLDGFYYKVNNGTLILSVKPRQGYADASSALSAQTWSDIPWYSSRLTITKVIVLDAIAPTSLTSWFDCQNLSSIEGLEKINTSDVTDMTMAIRTKWLTQLGIENLDTSKVISMSAAISYSRVPTDYVWDWPWDTKQVQDMSMMFSNITATNGGAFAGIRPRFDCRRVTTVNSMFTSCRAQSIDLSNCTNTSGISNYHGMFNYAPNLTSLNLSNWNFSGATDCRAMFDFFYSDRDSALTVLDLSGFNPSQTFDAREMFRRQNHLTTLDLSGLDASKIGSSTDMFNGCTAMQTAYCRSAADKAILDAIVSASGQSWTFTVKE